MKRNWIAGCAASLSLLPLAAAALAGELTVINPKSAFPEGPYVQADILFYAQYGDDKIMVFDDGETRVFWEQQGCGPAAIVPYGEGFLVTCFDADELVMISTEGRTMGSIGEDSSGEALLGPNDATSDGRGGLYVTGSGPWESAPIVGKVYHLDKAGVLKPLADDLHYANGIALSPDGKLLYVAESEAGRVITFAVEEDGSLSDRRSFVVIRFVDPPSGMDAFPDGLKVGPGGNLYIGQMTLGRIVVVSPEGAFVKAIEVPSAAAPNLAFSEDDRFIYIMAVDDVENPPYWGKVYRLTRDP